MSHKTLYYTWDLFYRTEKHVVKSKEEVLICFVHFILITNGFRCIGLGDSKSFEGNEPKSRKLPIGWNDVLQMRYEHEGKLYLFLVTKLDEKRILINLIRPHDKSVSLIELKTCSVRNMSGILDRLIPSYKELNEYVVEQFIDKMKSSKKTKDATCQTDVSLMGPVGRCQLNFMCTRPGGWQYTAEDVERFNIRRLITRVPRARPLRNLNVD
ncbi:PREDICTED: proteasome inhibitor PI31 subunit-like [Nicrophorus vespilloides]|uniref:Proteasome inhibitor PI31 subunit n=1 Tax=Nicrophorus vespilloides TaxID=110193 RepID=A0ABM1N821_NICVS|nr:PREDICTED: proteasome inhibitor PI31 subunit-like [Nicrophorus vespilloides]